MPGILPGHIAIMKFTRVLNGNAGKIGPIQKNLVMTWVNKLYREKWFLELDMHEQQESLNSIYIDGPVPVARETKGKIVDEVSKGMSALQQMDMTNEIKQLRTELIGIDGKGGVLALVREIRDDQKAIVVMYHDIDKKHELLESRNDGEHSEIKRDIDGIGRKAGRAMEISECTQKALDKHVKTGMEHENDVLSIKVAGPKKYMRDLSIKLLPDLIKWIIGLAILGGAAKLTGVL